jgi:2-octaprenyl-6-methoxyphenol hydroxylase
MPAATMPVARITHDFDAADISDQPFGWNLPNWLLRREFAGADLAECRSRLPPRHGTARLVTRESEALVTLSDGTARRRPAAGRRRRAQLAHAQALGIGVRTTRYGQKALAFAVTHPEPHDNVSTEIHRSGGPFTLVPLPDRDGQPCSAVVWMERGPRSRACGAARAGVRGGDDRALRLALRPADAGLALTVWPIISQIAERFAASAPR